MWGARHLWTVFGLLALLGPIGQAGASAPQVLSGLVAAQAKRGPLIFDRGPQAQEVWFPRDEELVYAVKIDLGVFGVHEVGKVTMTSRVAPFRPAEGSAEPLDDDHAPEQATVAARAVGSYDLYSVDEVISTQFQPQAWPKLLHKTVQTGTENRIREMLVGVFEGEPIARYRGDRHCKDCKDDAHYVDPTFFWNKRSHCKGCRRPEHRVWKDPVTTKIPADALDMVTAVMLARTVIAQGKPGAKFTLIDCDELWLVELSRGRRERHEVAAGTFDVVEVVLKTRPPEGAKGREEDFEGLFGLHGNISIWMHPESGVPVQITGTVPAGPIELDVEIELVRSRGTPDGFRQVVR